MNKILVVGIIFLFVCVGFQPVISIEINNSNEIIENEEDCNCNEIDNDELQSDIIQLKYFIRLALFLSKDNLEISDFQNSINYKNTNYNLFICFALHVIFSLVDHFLFFLKMVLYPILTWLNEMWIKYEC